MTNETDLRWVCLDCGARTAVAGDCAPCRTGPLLDLRDADVRETCLKVDDRARDRHNYRIWAIGAAPAITIAVLVLVLAIPFGRFIIGAGIALGALLSFVAGKLWPFKSRFAYIERR